MEEGLVQVQGLFYFQPLFLPPTIYWFQGITCQTGELGAGAHQCASEICPALLSGEHSCGKHVTAQATAILQERTLLLASSVAAPQVPAPEKCKYQETRFCPVVPVKVTPTLSLFY